MTTLEINESILTAHNQTMAAKPITYNFSNMLHIPFNFASTYTTVKKCNIISKSHLEQLLK